MRFTLLPALLCTALILLTACAAPGKSHPLPPTTPPQEPAAQPPSSPAGEENPNGDIPADTPPAGEGEAEGPAYCGTWTVTGLAAISPISALSQEAIDALTGSTVAYTPESFAAPGEAVCENPQYTESTTTAEALAADFQVSAEALDLPAGELRTLTIENAWGLGSFAVEKDAETLLLHLDGAWFTAARQE